MGLRPTHGDESAFRRLIDSNRVTRDFRRSANPPSLIPDLGKVLLVLLFHRLFFKWRSSVLKLKPRLWQNSLRRIPLLTNSSTNCRTSVRVGRLCAAT